jgi:mRNA-degrading endonuclease RelE of RelBE toxin-antitoxin system
MAFRIELSPAAREHIRDLTARQRTIVLQGIRGQLQSQPKTATRNRKPLRPESLAEWELRIGNIRVYYDVTIEPDEVVSIIAVGIKVRNRVRIGSEDVP